MLEGLKKVNWKKLEHAYGSAADVPELILKLTSNDQNVRDEAMWHLYGNIFHQGTRYEATVYAIPFIYELLREPTVPDKDILIKFILDLALGYADVYLPNGPNVEDWIDELKQMETRADTEELSDDDDYWIKDLDAFIKSYKAVLKELSTIREFLKSEDNEIRLNATFALAWFREEAKNSAPEVRKILKKEKIDKHVANAILSLSMLNSYLVDISDSDLFKGYFKGNYPQLIKISAAIALINILHSDIDDEVLEYLIAQLPILAEQEQSRDQDISSSMSVEMKSEENDDESYNEVYTSGGMGAFSEFPWNDGDLIGYISKVLKGFGITWPDKVIPPMCEALKKLSGIPAFNLTEALFWIVFPKAPKGENWTFAELNKYQKQVLKTLAENPNAWLLKDIDYGNFSLLMGDFRLPGTIDDLKKLMKIK